MEGRVELFRSGGELIFSARLFQQGAKDQEKAEGPGRVQVYGPPGGEVRRSSTEAWGVSTSLPYSI